ncbi:MAG: GNAT family N-acetyltransferase [Candidatus Micrarchaeia archaeon]|jgi:predicted GNAT family N-acyltransferase
METPEDSALTIRLAKNRRELNQVLKIREMVFVKGQGISLERERDGLDKSSKHAIVLYHSKPIGCARIRILDKKAKLERIAILKKYQGKGFGRKLADYLIEYCRRRKVKEIVMHSQKYIEQFYGSCGFKRRGKEFTDAGIKHVEMFLKVNG